MVRRGLSAALNGRTITAVEVIGAHGQRALRRNAAGPVDFVERITGREVVAVRRRGKYLWWALDNGDAVLAHLGMSGQFRVAPAGERPPAGPAEIARPHTRLRFHLAPGDLDRGQVVEFVDQRTFGGLSYVPGGAELPDPISHIARDLLDPLFDRPRVVRAVGSKHSGIKRVLLDQTVVSGIGNIYADEALWAARVIYDSPADMLSGRRIGTLLDAATGVMQAALAAGGTSFDSLYVNVNGESGYFERSLNVYGRAGEPCPRCGVVIVREPFMNRSSFRCPHCQGRRPTVPANRV